MAHQGQAGGSTGKQAAGTGTAPQWRDDIGTSYLALGAAFTITLAALLAAVVSALALG